MALILIKYFKNKILFWGGMWAFEHLYRLLGILKTGMLIKYSLNFLAIWSSQEIILSSLINVLLPFQTEVV